MSNRPRFALGAPALLALSLTASLVTGCDDGSDLGHWKRISTLPDATLEPVQRDLVGADPLLHFAIVKERRTSIVSLDVGDSSTTDSPFEARWARSRESAATIVTGGGSRGAVHVTVGDLTYSFGGRDYRSAAVVGGESGGGALPDMPVALVQPSGGGSIDGRPFVASSHDLFVFDPDAGEWTDRLGLPYGLNWMTTSIGEDTFTVGNAVGGVAVYRLERD